ncbi:myb-like protein M isoform X2 [Copidosoma floridanum]|nr:myb-like protein M isoform X2 [Copidosoma floridanum]
MEQELDNFFAPVKMEMLPLLSLNNEAEPMVLHPWQYPYEQQVRTDPGAPDGVGGTFLATQVPRSNILLNIKDELAQPDFNDSWEEDFQDLSGWCMTNGQQPRFDFHAGEFAMASKLTDTRIEHNNDLTAADKMTFSRKTTYTGSGETTLSVRRPQTSTYVVQPLHDHAYPVNDLQQQQQKHMHSNHSNNNNNIINVKMTMNTEGNLNNNDNNNNNNVAWQHSNNPGITVQHATGLPVYQQPHTMIDIESKQEPNLLGVSQDPFQILETNDLPKNFDLISFLCEENIPSPNDGVSTESSSKVTEFNSMIMPPADSSAHVIVSPKTYEPVPLSPVTPTDSKIRVQTTTDLSQSRESCEPSFLSSSTTAKVTIAKRSASGRQLRPVIKLENPDSPPSMERRTRIRKTRTSSMTSRSSTSSWGKCSKRMHESDSDDEQYRETREKNNEASRRSRMNKKTKDREMVSRAIELEKNNRILKMKVEELDKLVTSLRNALLRLALKRETKTDVP